MKITNNTANSEISASFMTALVGQTLANDSAGSPQPLRVKKWGSGTLQKNKAVCRLQPLFTPWLPV
jgi:hypothetical protein